jgi:4-amino-4-deoxy-L-arabinose transferase-like glycosyltransferase
LVLAGIATQAYRYGFPASLNGPIGTWRRTQTAWGIRSMMRGSLSPLEAQVPVLGPPWKVPFEFPMYQWVSAVLGRLTGLDEVVAGRMVATLALVATGVLTYYLGARLIAPAVGVVAATFIVLSPYGIHWGAEISIEYFTVALSGGAFLAGRTWLLQGGRNALVVYLVLAGLASLSKLTTLVPWLVGLGVLALFVQGRSGLPSVVWRVGVLGVALVPGVLWSRWADAVKADNPHAAPFVTSRMWAHNFGRLSDRVEMGTWQFLFRNVFDTTVGGAAVALILFVVAAARSECRRETAVLGSVALAGPAIFASLYWAHPYYAVAIMPALTVLLATGLVTAVQRLFAGSSPRAVRSAIVASFLGVTLLAATTPEGVELMNATLLRNRAVTLAYDDIAEFTTPDDALLVVSNVGWDPTLSFVTDRRMLMLFPSSDPNSSRPSDTELGTTYRYAYWMGDAPSRDDWNEYLPATVELVPLSPKLYRIEAGSVG